MLLMKGASLAYDVYPDPALRVRHLFLVERGLALYVCLCGEQVDAGPADPAVTPRRAPG